MILALNGAEVRFVRGSGGNRCGCERRVVGEGLTGAHNGVRGDKDVE